MRNLTNTTFQTIVSNDATQYYLSDSDEQGNGGLTNTELISPAFSLAGYTDATLSFWHYYLDLDGSADIQITNDTDAIPNNGETWTTLVSYTSTQGANTNFKNVLINLLPYAGQTNLRIKFKYTNAPWAWFWAVDNVKVFGNAPSAITWSPITGLYTDAAATIPYTAGAAATTVYAKPGTTSTYTASSSSALLCTRYSTPVTIDVTVINTGTVAPLTQTVCGASSDIVITGSSNGTVLRWQYSSSPTFASGVFNIASSASNTLTAAQIGALSATRYFRAQFTNGSCIKYSTIAEIVVQKAVWNGSAWDNVTGPTNSISAEFQGDYSSTGDLNACGVIVTSGNVLFNTNHTLTVQNQVTVNGGTLTFADDSSLYQVVDVANAPGVYAGGNSGNITYNRTTTPLLYYDYTYWSAPVYAQPLANVSTLTPFAYFFEYDGTNWQWINSINVMTPGKGYIIRAPSTFNVSPPATMTHTAPFYGVPNNGDITVPIIGGASQLNLLGNPYPSALSADAFINDLDNSSTLNGTIYLWTHHTPITANVYTGSDYAVYNYVGGVGGTGTPATGTTTVPNGKIASGQGFFIKGLDTGTATFKNSMRIAANNDQFFRMNTAATNSDSLEKSRYWLDIANSEGAYKQTLIGYVENATTGIDRLFDGEMVDIGNTVTLYTIAEDVKLSIQGRPLPFDVNETLPLGYKSTIDGNYTITLSDFDGLFESQNIYLEDTQLNIIHDLKVSAYTFTTLTGTFEDRFILRYTTEALGVNNPSFNENTVVVYQNQTGLHINSGTQNMENVTIFDVRGRKIASQKQIGNTETVFTTLPTTQQVLLVKIEAENGAVVTKKVVY